MDKAPDELAHCDYWDARYKASIIGRPNSPASSVGRTAITSSQADSDDDDDDEGQQHGDLDTYDWFRNWEHLETWTRETLPSSMTHPKILHLGCGNSTLTKDLHDLGFTDQTNIDFSEVVIRGMKSKYKRLDAQWRVMDVRQMSFQNQAFDIAIDKGTMDSMFHGSMWDPPDDVRDNIQRYLSEVARILVPGGTFLYITYRQPHFIRPLLIREEIWRLDVQRLPDKGTGGVFEYFAYMMKKHGTNGEAK